jgi:hypothetical protein
MTCDKQTAKRRLTNRYSEQCRLFPITRAIPLHRYIRRNIADVMRDDLLKEYGATD